MPDAAAADVTEDWFLGRRLQLRQPRAGHRAGTDAILLAAAVPAAALGHLLDIGAGVGAAGLAIAALRPGVDLGLVEIDPALAALAAENLTANGLGGRGRVYVADVCDAESLRHAGLVAGAADFVVTNPPFFDPARTRGQSGKRAAHVMPKSGPEPLAAWIKACIVLLGADGLFIMIHRPEALPAILQAADRLGALTILPIHPHAEKPASRILLRGRKGSRAPLAVAAPLILHAQAQFSDKVEAIHRGEALLDW